MIRLSIQTLLYTTDLPNNPDPPPWPGLPEASRDKQDALIQHVRYVLFRHKDFDTITHPCAP